MTNTLATRDTFQPKGSPIRPTKSATRVTGGSTPNVYRFSIDNEMDECITVETGDVIRCMVGDSFVLGNIIKACRRIYLKSLGRGKDGTTIEYDTQKIKYFAEEFAKFNKEN